jgi:predicted DNA-binding transcriptional regulator YafY
MKTYQDIPRHVTERLEIAILTGETLALNWADEDTDQAWMGRVRPLEVIQHDGRLYLEADNEQGERIRIRLDLIRNLPTPVK